MAYQHHHDITDTIINSITHALINGAVYKVMHNLSPGMAVGLAVAGVGVLWLFSRKRF